LDRPLTTDELNYPFYAYEGGTISVAEGLGSLQAVGAQGALQDKAQAAERVGRLLLPVDENAIEVNGLRIESRFPAVALRSESWQLLFYGIVGAVFVAGVSARYWRRSA
jgi:hypothetical protein